MGPNLRRNCQWPAICNVLQVPLDLMEPLLGLLQLDLQPQHTDNVLNTCYMCGTADAAARVQTIAGCGNDTPQPGVTSCTDDGGDRLP